MPIEVRFKCDLCDSDYLTVSSDIGCVIIKSYYRNELINTHNLDIPTAIKLSKSIRTEINKAKGI